MLLQKISEIFRQNTIIKITADKLDIISPEKDTKANKNPVTI